MIRLVRTPGQFLFSGATLLACWLGMQALHELGHILAAKLSGGVVTNVALHPMGISRTDVAPNPRPLAVAWGGPLLGSLVPLVLWSLVARLRIPHLFLWRFFAGFCLVANGLYLGIGSIDRVGDCGELLSHGASHGQLWAYGAVATILGLWLWNGQGEFFGWGKNARPIERGAMSVVLITAGLLVVMGLVVGS